VEPIVLPLGAADIPAAMTLVRQERWNQTSADWLRFLSTTPAGCFKAVVEDQLVGTIATIVHDGRFAWIGMMLVDPGHRRRGIAQRLLDATLAVVDRRGLDCAMLDATPAGQPLYEKSGFVARERIERWELPRPVVRRTAVAPTGPISERTLELDRALFGADRRELLRSFEGEAPELALEIADTRAVHGYAFGRHGTQADHLGPLMARDSSAAARLLDAFLDRSTRALIYVDCFVDRPWTRSLLEERGFRISRPLVRMCRGTHPPPPAGGDLLAIAGPEFG
jgi:GNAT superfamily N-acetyltransferase